MEKSLLKTTLHGGALAILTYGYQSLGSLSVDKFIRGKYGGHFQYLTIQGLVLVWLTMFTGLLTEVLSFMSLRTLKRYLMVMALPLSVVISVIYWSLILFMPRLILQSFSDQSSLSTLSADLFRIPLSIDLALHAAPCLFLLFDFFFFEVKYSKNEVNFGAPVAAIVFSVWYSLWVEHCGKKNDGTFPYPFLTENTLAVRIGIYLGATLLAIISFRVINYLHH
ncbi:hypothetical protein GALMADRAFT_239488 [Galerina marginata CBS 339.88]|uniref:FAR-17a/AIG1-like protein n=1 Tax=Galerina marginata (strain CBS 339.88) TaxID=685588 RepID=A0A067TNN9_GALM3|nr:hypothetical protein GALMADRAFT_239488 [Galerina marginata CBS 339.88]